MLKRKRAELGLSRPDLERLSGVPARTIEKWEQRGIDHATVGNLRKVARALGCTVGDLAGD